MENTLIINCVSELEILTGFPIWPRWSQAHRDTFCPVLNLDLWLVLGDISENGFLGAYLTTSLLIKPTGVGARVPVMGCLWVEVSQGPSTSDSFQKLSQAKSWHYDGRGGSITGWGTLTLKVGQWWMAPLAISRTKPHGPSSVVCPLHWD